MDQLNTTISHQPFRFDRCIFCQKRRQNEKLNETNSLATVNSLLDAVTLEKVGII